MEADPREVLFLAVHVYTPSSLVVTKGNTMVGAVSSGSNVSWCDQLNWKLVVLEVFLTRQVKTR